MLLILFLMVEHTSDLASRLRESNLNTLWELWVYVVIRNNGLRMYMVMFNEADITLINKWEEAQ